MQAPRDPSAASVLKLALLQTLRDFRAGELRLVLAAVLLAVAALTSVGFFADRLQAGLRRDASQLLGGDAVIGSDQPTPPAFIDRAREAGLLVSTTATFPSMARAPDLRGGAARLVGVKSVSDTYPLRGVLQLRPVSSTADTNAAPMRSTHGPARGTVWVDAALISALNLQPGDALLLGDAQLTVAQVIVDEPDRGAGFLSFAPRVMLNEADLAATGLVQPASRVTYRLAVAASKARDASVARYVKWAGETIKRQGLRGIRVESLESGRPEMRQTLARAEKFLNLVALLSALLSAVAVAIAARDFAGRHLDDCAMLRVLGQSQRRIAWTYGLEFAGLGLLASVAGVALGYALHYAFFALLGSLVPADLPPPGVWPALFGVGAGLSLLLGFGLPPVLQLSRVPALRVIRRDIGTPKLVTVAVFTAGTAGFAALLWVVARDAKLGAIAVGGFAVALCVFALLAWMAVRLLRRLVPEASAPHWLILATRQAAARPAFAVLQIASLSVGLMALALLVLLRTDLISSWRAATPPDAPNRFVINVQPDQGDAFRKALMDAGITRYDWYPMVRGRLVSINGGAVRDRYAEDEQARRSVEREFNLSYSTELPAHNQLSSGRWTPGEADGLSVEQGLAETLGVKLGDTLRFDIAGELRDARVTSLRKVDWGSMRVNFFVIYPLSQMDGLPVTYISAFRAPQQAAAFDNALTAHFPNVTAIDIGASLSQVQRVLDQVIRAVEFLFAFTLATGVVVLLAAVSATREARAREFAVMRACGASAALLAQVQRAELLGVGALAGLLGTGAAVAVGWALARYAFDFAWTASPVVPLAGMGCGALLALVAGWWALRDVLRRPVMESLRRAGEA